MIMRNCNVLSGDNNDDKQLWCATWWRWWWRGTVMCYLVTIMMISNCNVLPGDDDDDEELWCVTSWRWWRRGPVMCYPVTIMMISNCNVLPGDDDDDSELWCVTWCEDSEESYLRMSFMNCKCVRSSSRVTQRCSLCCSRCWVSANSSRSHAFSWHSLRTCDISTVCKQPRSRR